MSGFRISVTLGSFVLLDLGMGFRVEPDEEPEGPPVEFGFAMPCEAPDADDPVFRQLYVEFPDSPED